MEEADHIKSMRYLLREALYELKEFANLPAELIGIPPESLRNIVISPL